MGLPFTRSNPLPPALPISLCLIVSGCERRPKSGLLTHVSPSSLQLPCPYALTQAGRGSLACTLHLHVALPPQNNRPSNLMRLRYEETLRACHGCVCMCVHVYVVGGALGAFLLPKTNFLCADLCLCVCCQLVRPVTVVPNVPGIPGPPSPQPQPAQSEAKLVFIISSLIYIKCCFHTEAVIPHLREVITAKVMRESNE